MFLIYTDINRLLLTKQLIIMKTINFKKSIVLLFTILVATMGAFSQNEERTKAAKEAAVSLTNSMIETLKLTATQVDTVTEYNELYAVALFTTVPLTDEAIKGFDSTLGSNLSGVLSEEQYSLWLDNKDVWLSIIKEKVPKEETLPEQEY